MKQAIFVALTLLIGFSACQKKDDPLADTTQVVTTISSPTEGQIFKNGDTVHIQATVTYTAELHGYEVIITDTSSGQVLYDVDDHVHTDHFNITGDWAVSTTQQKSLKLSVITIINHQGVKATENRYFVVKP